MPRYYFDIHDGLSVRDDDGQDLPDLPAAIDEAGRLASTYVVKPGMLGQKGGAVVVEIRHGSGIVLSTLRLVFSVETPGDSP